MTNNTTDEEEEYPFLPVDPLLQYVVSLADEIGISIPLTLTVKGIIITGKTIKRDKYYDRLNAIFGNPTTFINPVNERSAQIFADHFLKVLNTFRNLSAEPDSSGKISRPLLIHLENVHIVDVSTGHQLEMKDGLWRGRIDSVDGFIFGNP
jgi:hypothetical protein